MLYCRFWEVFALFSSFLGGGGGRGSILIIFGNFIDDLFSLEVLEYFCHLKISREFIVILEIEFFLSVLRSQGYFGQFRGL